MLASWAPARRSSIVFLALSVAAAAVFVRLGVWQLSRGHERRERNAVVAARLAWPEVDIARIASDTASMRFRRVSVTGVFDYAHELVVTSRTYEGSPGIHILTPLRRAGRDTAVLVNRGWVYSPDGFHADLTRWRERDSVTVHGFVEEFPSADATPRGGTEHALRRPNREAAERYARYPMAPFYVVLTDSSASLPAGRIGRVPPPPLDEGPHLSYAIQWLAFAAIAIIGGIAVTRRRASGSIVATTRGD